MSTVFSQKKQYLLFMQKFFLKPPSKKKKINEIRGVFSEIAGFTTGRNGRKIYLWPNFSPIILLCEKLLKKNVENI